MIIHHLGHLAAQAALGTTPAKGAKAVGGELLEGGEKSCRTAWGLFFCVKPERSF